MSGLTDDDLHLFNEGTHYRLYQRLGAHPGADGTAWLVTDWGDDLPAALVEALATPEPML